MSGEKQWDTTNDVVAWLESPEGEEWSRLFHAPGYRKRLTLLMVVKDDDEDSQIFDWLWLWVA